MQGTEEVDLIMSERAEVYVRTYEPVSLLRVHMIVQ